MTREEHLRAYYNVKQAESAKLRKEYDRKLEEDFKNLLARIEAEKANKGGTKNGSFE